MFSEVREGKRVITKEIKLDTDIEAVLYEYHFKEHHKNLFYLPNDKNIRVEVIIERDDLKRITVVNLKIIGSVKEFLFFKTVKNTWVLQDESGWVSLNKEGDVIIEIMNKIREFWDWYVNI